MTWGKRVRGDLIGGLLALGVVLTFQSGRELELADYTIDEEMGKISVTGVSGSIPMTFPMTYVKQISVDGAVVHEAEKQVSPFHDDGGMVVPNNLVINIVSSGGSSRGSATTRGNTNRQGRQGSGQFDRYGRRGSSAAGRTQSGYGTRGVRNEGR